ncbi:MAG TPA: hypothetical protein VMW08_00685 [Acidimicrobiales bacterium]|nr:hypothetical protein [Acidimicrobiales bacterium]
MSDEPMDGYPDIYDQLVETDPLELRDRARRLHWWLGQLCESVSADDMTGLPGCHAGAPAWGWLNTPDSISITRPEAAELAELLGLEGGPRPGDTDG